MTQFSGWNRGFIQRGEEERQTPTSREEQSENSSPELLHADGVVRLRAAPGRALLAPSESPFQQPLLLPHRRRVGEGRRERGRERTRARGPELEAHVSLPSRGLSLLTQPRGEVTALDPIVSWPHRAEAAGRTLCTGRPHSGGTSRVVLSLSLPPLFVPRQLRRGGHNFSSGETAGDNMMGVNIQRRA